MNYKGRFQPSQLLDPWTFNWIKWEDCMMNIMKRPNISLESGVTVEVEVMDVKIEKLLFWSKGKIIRKQQISSAINEFCQLVGDLCYDLIIVE